MLQFMGSQRVGHDRANELKLKSNHQEIIIVCAIICEEQSVVEAN